jgi:hypothetical protein
MERDRLKIGKGTNEISSVVARLAQQFVIPSIKYPRKCGRSQSSDNERMASQDI